MNCGDFVGEPLRAPEGRGSPARDGGFRQAQQASHLQVNSDFRNVRVYPGRFFRRA
jgi:hypothetical protein